MIGLTIAFWVLAIVAIAGALGVVLVRNVFRAALSLIVCLLAIAGLFVTLYADFLAAVQILVYVGAISVLIIIAIMMTGEVTRGSTSNKLVVPAFIVAVLFFAVVAYAMVNTNWQIAAVTPAIQAQLDAGTTQALAGKLFGATGFILPLEIAPVLLLAAILGAIVVVREK